MESELLEAIRENDISSFLSLYQENEGILQQRTADSSSTALHLACSYGHIEMVSEIVRLCPKMVAFQNNNLETPFHEACRQGNVKVLMLLLQHSPSTVEELVSTAFNTCLSLACSHGHLDTVYFLLNQPGLAASWKTGLDEISVAISRGYTDIVRELLNKWPELAQMVDKNGDAMLHHACNGGRREIAWILLRREPSVALIRNNNGYTPIHLAVIKGKLSILQDFSVIDQTSFSCLTGEEETIFHLAVRYGHYDALVFLNGFCKGTNLLLRQDRYGNTVLHLAVTAGRHEIAEYLINKTNLEINTQNSEGITVLDILDQDEDSAEHRHLEAAFIRAGAKRSVQLLSPSLEIEGTNSRLPNHSKRSLSRSKNSSPKSSLSSSSNDQLEAERSFHDENSRLDSMRIRSLISKQYMRKKQNKERNQLLLTERNKHNEMYTEALQNARNTIIVVAILISTVTYAGGISPPGGVYQDGPMKGKSTVGKTMAFKVFAVSNEIALLTSLAIVIVLVSIIPFRRNSLKMLLVISHKVMWVAVAFMATAYGAATWIILPHSHGTEWLTVALLTVGCGLLGTIFIGLNVIMVEQWLRKSKWKRPKRGSFDLLDHRGSLNSVVEVHFEQGYDSL